MKRVSLSLSLSLRRRAPLVNIPLDRPMRVEYQGEPSQRVPRLDSILFSNPRISFFFERRV